MSSGWCRAGPWRSGMAYSRVIGAATAKGSEHVRVVRRQDPLLFDPKKSFGILRRRFLDVFHAEAVNLGNLLGDVADVGGFVALAAMRDGCEVGAVSLHQGAVQRDRLDDIAQHRRVLERDDA